MYGLLLLRIIRLLIHLAVYCVQICETQVMAFVSVVGNMLAAGIFRSVGLFAVAVSQAYIISVELVRFVSHLRWPTGVNIDCQ